jgi:hypothetical protein
MNRKPRKQVILAFFIFYFFCQVAKFSPKKKWVLKTKPLRWRLWNRKKRKKRKKKKRGHYHWPLHYVMEYSHNQGYDDIRGFGNILMSQVTRNILKSWTSNHWDGIFRLPWVNQWPKVNKNILYQKEWLVVVPRPLVKFFLN